MKSEQSFGESTEAPAGYLFSAEAKDIDFDYVYAYLSQDSYWAKGIGQQRLARAIKGSLCFSAAFNGKQIAFARVVSDEATFAYLCDVFVDPAHRGCGVGKWFAGSVLTHPSLREVRRWLLATRDAHGLYRQFGFKSLFDANFFMERLDATAYERDRAETQRNGA